MVTVVCTRWLDAFPASYVTVLRNAVAANLDREHRFICVTDNPDGLDSDVEGVAMPDLGIPLRYQQRGCWPKLSIFAPGVLPPSEPTLYLDLDLMVRGDLGCFFDRIEETGGFHALREWNPAPWNLLPLSMRPHRGVQGSILGFYPELLIFPYIGRFHEVQYLKIRMQLAKILLKQRKIYSFLII